MPVQNTKLEEFVCACTFLSQVCVHDSEFKSKVYLGFLLSKGPADMTGGQQVRITWLTMQVEETPQQTAATPLSKVVLLGWFAATSFIPFHWIWLASKVIFNRRKCTTSSYCLFWGGGALNVTANVSLCWVKVLWRCQHNPPRGFACINGR